MKQQERQAVSVTPVNNMIRITGFVCLALMVLASCRSTKKIQSAIAKKDTTATAPLDNGKADTIRFIQSTLTKLNANRINYNTFSAKINVDYQGSDGKKYDVNAFVRMQKDSVIWVSVNAVLGIEAMRIMINKDSVWMINKLDKEFTARSLEVLQDVASLPLDLSSMQELIVGNPVFFDTTKIVSYHYTGEDISMLSFGEFFRHLITLSGSSHVVLNSKLDDVDPLMNRTCFLNYSDYEDKKGVYFSTNRVISVTAKTKLDVKLNYKQYEFNEVLSFPFSVPKNYVHR